MQQTCLQRTAVPTALRARVPRAGRKHAVLCRAQQQESEQPMLSRREGLLAAAAGLALAGSFAPVAPALAEEATTSRLQTKYLKPENLSVFQKQGQKKLMVDRTITALKKVLTKDDAPTAVRAVLLDAASYDVATGTGGVNGSIVTSEELSRPENASVKAYIDKLRVAKKEIDEGAAAVGQAAISWADLLAVGGKVATEQLWYDIKVNSAELESGGKVIAENFATEFVVQLGRLDAASADAAAQIPAAGAPIDDVKTFFLALGAKPNEGTGSPFTPKPPFWERVSFVLWPAAAADPVAEEARIAADPDYAKFKKKYDLSRRTVTRTDYEVDFIEYYNKLCNLGAKFDQQRYLFPLEIQVPKKL